MVYAILDQLIADYIPEAKKPSEIAAIERLLYNVSAFVDRYCDRPDNFFIPTAPERRWIRGEGSHILRLPQHVRLTIESVTHDGVLIDTTTYYESTRNGWLYYKNWADDLENTFSDSLNRQWYLGATYAVVARWGYNMVPYDLTEAVRQTVARLWQTQKGTLGEVTPNGFVVERAMPPFAREVLDRYKRRPFEV